MDGERMTVPHVAKALRHDVEEAPTAEVRFDLLVTGLKEMAAIEQMGFKAERSEFVRWRSEERKWLKLLSILQWEIPVAISGIQEEVAALVEDERFGQAPPEVQERLRNRKRGLEITCRMLEGLSQRLRLLNNDGNMGNKSLRSLKLYPRVCEARFKELYELEPFLTEVDVLLEEILGEEATIRDENYQATRDLRMEVDRLKRAVTGFINDRFLPLLDGLQQGIRDEQKLREPLTPYDSEKDLIDRWFGTYHSIWRRVKGVAKRISLFQVEARRGGDFNPERHMALGTESCSALRDEQILDVLRNGWRLWKTVIRPAEVVVVKNERGI